MTRRNHVTPEMAEAVFARDKGCVLAKLDPPHVCRDRWGNVCFPTDACTIEHVKSDLRMGRRAPSDMKHLVALCHGSNLAVPSKVQRTLMREYLAIVSA